jgi:hypothetical protein
MVPRVPDLHNPNFLYSLPRPTFVPDDPAHPVWVQDEPVAPPPVPFCEGVEPPMMSNFYPRYVQVNAGERVLVNLPTAGAPGVQFVTQANLAARGRTLFAAGSAYEIADNESPRPLDRVFTTFAYFRTAVGTADTFPGPNPLLPVAGGLSNFGPPGPGASLGPGSTRAVSFLQQLGASTFQPQYSRYVLASLGAGNFVLPVVDTATAALLLHNASGNNFLTPANRLLLSHLSDAQFQATVSGVLVQTGVRTAPVTGLQFLTRTFERSTGQQLFTNPVDLYRETFGFEKTFLDGKASFELRMPVSQYRGDEFQDREGVGDLTAVFKYAAYCDPKSGDLLSGGLAVTAPTGRGVTPFSSGSPVNPTLLQPWVGGITHWHRFYLESFTSLIVPLDRRDALVLTGDMGVGYVLYNNPLSDVLTSVIPTIEAHFTDPLRDRGINATFVGMPDLVYMTGGCSFTVQRWFLTLGAGIPLTGPKPIDFGVFGQVNVVF